MTNLSGKLSKGLSPALDDLLLRAYVPRGDGQGFVAASFMRSSIDAVLDIGEGVSGIALRSGIKITVRMPYDALEKDIYFADLRRASVLDLRDVTGGAAPVPALAGAFDAAAAQQGAAGKELKNIPLVIALFARQAQQQNFQMVFLKEADIDWSRTEGHADGRNGAYTKLLLKNGYGPFGSREILFDMPRPKFMELYNLAKIRGESELDLRDWTRRRDPDKTKPPPKMG